VKLDTHFKLVFELYSDPYCQSTCLSVGCLSLCLSTVLFKMLHQQFLSE